jgi:hypothetical protein
MALDQWGGDLYWDTLSTYGKTIAEYDTLSGTFSSVVVAGNNDTVAGGRFADVLIAAGNDDMVTSGGMNTLIATGDDDMLFAAGGDTLIAAGRGDQLYGSGSDTLIATGNSETLVGDGADTLVAAGSGAVLTAVSNADATFVGDLAGNTLVGWSSRVGSEADYTFDHIAVDLGKDSAIGIAGSDTLVNIHTAVVTGDFDTLIGPDSGSVSLTAIGSHNVLIGQTTARGILTTDGSYNTLVVGGGGRLPINTLSISGGSGNTLISNSNRTIFNADIANGNTFVSSGIGRLFYTEDGLAVDLVAGRAMAGATTGDFDTLIGVFSYAKATGDHDTLIASASVSGMTLEAYGNDDTLVGSPGISTLISDMVGGNTLIAGGGGHGGLCRRRRRG